MTDSQKTRALVVFPDLPRHTGQNALGNRTTEQRLTEAVGLAESIGLDVPSAVCIRVPKIRAASLLGTGAIDGLKDDLQRYDAGLLIMDCALGPAQQRTLEKALDAKVIDRTGLILEIFGARARTHEGRLQVELAALTYQRSRLVRGWTHLERQRGGTGTVGGPGESQLEIDRRLTDERIAKLKKALDRVKRTRGLHRGARQKVPYPIVALVGYTNAGKSTLFNRLTRAEVLAEDKLFATLDPTMRRVSLDNGCEVIMSDTVGFISDLPTQLVASFRATLEEVQAADLIIHVRDSASEDSDAQRQDVEAVLGDLGVGNTRRLTVMNKIDQLDAETRQFELSRCARDEGLVAVSALTGEGLDELRRSIGACLASGRNRVTFAVPASQGDAVAWLHRHSLVEGIEPHGNMLECQVRIDEAESQRFSSRFSIAPRSVAAPRNTA